MASIELIEVSKRFRSLTALNRVSLDVAEGETLALFGPSGAGKTVLLRLIAGVIAPDKGRILLGGTDMKGVAPEDRRVGMAFQNFALFPHLNAFENIASPLRVGRTPAATVREGVESVARLLKIDHVLDHAPRALSNGQKQRTALARALAGKPRVLLLDDPLRNVDAKLRFEMRLELPRLLAQEGATTIYVTQDYKEAMALGDRIAVLDGGGLVQVGRPEEIYFRPATLKTAQLFGDPTINLLDVVPETDANGPFARVSDVAAYLDPGLAHAAGRPCTLGIRPEAINFVAEGAPGAIPVTVAAETPLNEKAVTLVRTKRGREILVSRPAGAPGPAKGRAHVALDAERGVLFDRETGARIEPRAPAENRQGAAA